VNLVSGVQTVVALVLAIGSLGLTGFALADVVRRRGTLFPHAGRLSKGAWLGILIAAFLIALLSLTQALATGSAPLGLLNIAGVIAAGVYLADVKPKLKQLGGGNTNNDPYGKW
jgi:uncharacterized protein DUF2516